MAFDFPASPTNGQIFTPSGGPTYVWNGTVWNQVSGNPATLTAQARNRVCNPAFQISQENVNTGSLVTGSNVGYYPADQWLHRWALGTGTLQSVRQILRTPNGSIYTALVGVGVAKPTLAAGEYLVLSQYIEGTRIVDFAWGTALAKPIVVRFWAYSSVSGKFSFRLYGGGGRSYVHQFDCVATTWTLVTAAVPGDTAGTWVTDNTLALSFEITLAPGSTIVGSTVDAWQAANMFAGPGQTNLAATTANFTVADAGIYLDPQNTGLAPPWVMPDEAQELAACQRYFTKLVGFLVSGYQAAGGVTFGNAPLSPNMRIAGAGSVANISYANASALVPNSASTSDLQMKITMTAAGAGWGIGDITLNARM